MRKRGTISKGKSKSNFKKNTKAHKKNYLTANTVARGGYRL